MWSRYILREFTASPVNIQFKFLELGSLNDILFQDRVLSLYTDAQLKELSASPQFAQLSSETKDDLFKKSCDALAKANSRINY